MRITLYSRQKGKQMYASGSWRLTKREKILVYIACAFFAISVIDIRMGIKGGLIPSIVCLVISVLSLFCVLFGLVHKKHKENPMDAHYYDIDYSYSARNGEVIDRTQEVSKEEFFGQNPEKSQ